jgi:hypothetical protein
MSYPQTGRTARRRVRRISSIATAAILVLALAGSALAGLVSGSLPSAAFTFTSVTDNAVNMDGNGVHLKTKGPITVKTTYSQVAPSDAFVGGWHYHNGPVLVTVTVGTLTYFGADCHTWDLTAGHTYIESSGEVLNAKILAVKNPGGVPAEWFTTRLYPNGAADPVVVSPAPCTP